MSRRAGSRRGRPIRRRRIRVRTERRSEIDYAGLARAVLEQAAMDEQSARQSGSVKGPQQAAATKPGEEER